MMKPFIIALALCAVCIGAALAAACGGESASAPSGERGLSQSATAPDFTLTSASGEAVSLSAVLDERRGAALVFYRGFF